MNQIFPCYLQTPCSESPCVHGGTCVDLNHPYDFKCNCPPGFGGKNCENGRSSSLNPLDRPHVLSQLIFFVFSSPVFRVRLLGAQPCTEYDCNCEEFAEGKYTERTKYTALGIWVHDRNLECPTVVAKQGPYGEGVRVGIRKKSGCVFLLGPGKTRHVVGAASCQLRYCPFCGITIARHAHIINLADITKNPLLYGARVRPQNGAFWLASYGSIFSCTDPQDGPGEMDRSE